MTTAAILTIRRPGSMTAGGHKAIARWLRAHADMIEKEGHKYTLGTFRGRYIGVPKAPKAKKAKAP